MTTRKYKKYNLKRKIQIQRKLNRRSIIKLGLNLRRNLDFVSTLITENMDFLEAYKRQFGDIYYRPIIGRNEDGTPVYGEPTTTFLPMVAESYKNFIKDILLAIKTIEKEIAPPKEEDPTNPDDSEDSEEDGEEVEFDAETFLNNTRKGKK